MYGTSTKRTVAATPPRIAGGAIGACVIGAAWRLGAFEPAGGCQRSAKWPAELIALHTVADGLVFTAYVWIPTVLLLIYFRLKTRPEARLLYLFGAFIVLCGWTHLDSIITTWWPAYWYAGGVKLATGLVSIATAITLTRLAPQLVGLGSVASDLQAAIAENVELRKSAEARATRAEGEVTELEQAQRKLREALAKAERETAAAERARQAAIESARSAEAARRQAEAAQEEKQAIQRAVKALTTPVLPLTDDIVVMPLIGELDSLRAAQARDVALEYMARNQVAMLILDLSGVPVVDTQVGASLLGTIQAVGLIGGKCVITGIQPDVAQAVVDIGIDMSGVITKGTLKAGLAEAMQMVGAK